MDLQMIHQSGWLGSLWNVLRKFLYATELCTLDRRYISIYSKDSVSCTFICVSVYVCMSWMCVVYSLVWKQIHEKVRWRLWMYFCITLPCSLETRSLDKPGIRLILINYQQFYFAHPSSTGVTGTCGHVWPKLLCWHSKYSYPVNHVPQIHVFPLKK